MALSLYLMPMTGTGVPGDRRRPKYMDTILTPNAVEWYGMQYGYQPVCLLAAEVTPEVHAQIIAMNDDYAFPAAFQTTGESVGNANASLTKTLEDQYGIPAQWLTPQMPYTDVAHTIGAMFQYLQRMNGIMGNVFPFAGSTLSDQIKTLPKATQDAMQEAAITMGFSSVGITPNTTIRNAIKLMADQWGATPLILGPFIF
jgi:hypothetical protein